MREENVVSRMACRQEWRSDEAGSLIDTSDLIRKRSRTSPANMLRFSIIILWSFAPSELKYPLAPGSFRFFGLPQPVKRMNFPPGNELRRPRTRASPRGQTADGWRVATVRGPFDYRHYRDDGFDDSGWGCGYRSLQTILSWYRLGHLAQGGLSGDAQGGFNGDAQGGCSGDVPSGREVPGLMPQLLAHFESQGAPAMIGGSTDPYSKTLLGVAVFKDDTRRPFLLIADPHFELRAGEDAAAARARALADGWVDSKSTGDLSVGSFYNIALPQRADPTEAAARGYKNTVPLAAGVGARAAPPAGPPSAPAATADFDFEMEVVEQTGVRIRSIAVYKVTAETNLFKRSI
jgi:hypothetical protein